MDCVPGRLNEVVIDTKRTGMIVGQCSELCGVEHFNMPVVITILPKNDFFYYMLVKFMRDDIQTIMRKTMVQMVYESLKVLDNLKLIDDPSIREELKFEMTKVTQEDLISIKKGVTFKFNS